MTVVTLNQLRHNDRIIQKTDVKEKIAQTPSSQSLESRMWLWCSALENGWFQTACPAHVGLLNFANLINWMVVSHKRPDRLMNAEEMDTGSNNPWC